ncbi:MAG TPA: histidinol-phosphate transaminase [Stellaceae bacterium]|nr:histidinol-phosphate transaminase [Stellaceae bacterium]
MPSVTPKEHLLSIYRSSERNLGRDGFVALDRNERVSPIPHETFKSMLASLSAADLTSYPDAGPFVARLARAVGLGEDHIAELAGSDAGIRRAFMAYLRPGDRVVALNPGYAMYALYTRIFEGVLERIEFGADRSPDLAALLAAIKPGVRIVILAHPDQPMGVAIAPEALRQVVERAASVGALCIVDEAYHPFHPVTVADWVREFDHLLVLRSFSKYPGCAGLRLGYALGNPTLIDGLMAVRGGNEVSGVSLALGCYLLDHPEIAEEFRHAVAAGRDVLIAGVTKLGLEALPCVTNFQLLRCRAGDDVVAIATALERRRYLVKADFDHPALANCMRVSLNGPDVMTPFVAALAEAVAETRKHVARPVA